MKTIPTVVSQLSIQLMLMAHLITSVAAAAGLSDSRRVRACIVHCSHSPGVHDWPACTLDVALQGFYSTAFADGNSAS